MAHDERPGITVTVVFAAAPHVLETETLSLPAGATVAQAQAASSLLRRHLGPAGAALGAVAADAVANGAVAAEASGASPQPARLRLGLWGRLCAPGDRLQDQDRLELLRPLTLDPMEARRQRLRRDGLRPPRRSPRPPRGG